MPRVSVVVPTYNQAKFILETLHSVQNQSYKDWECVVVNDGSPDNTDEVLAPFLKEHPQFVYIKQPNAGVSAARNNGITAASGDYILPLDSDDTLHPQCLEKMAHVLDNNPNIHIVGCDTNRFGLITTPYRTCEYIEQMSTGAGNMMNYCSMYRKSVWEAVGGYDESYAKDGLTLGMEDWDFWLKCMEHKFKLRKLPIQLFNYRLHGDSNSTKVDLFKEESYRKSHEATWNKHLERTKAGR